MGACCLTPSHGPPTSLFAGALRGGHLSLPTKKSAFLEALLSVLGEVEAALEGLSCEAWERELALALAGEMDESPNASLAKELRSVMADLGAAKPVESGDVADDLAAKRAERRRAQGS